MMRQAQIAEGKIAKPKLRHTLAKLKDGEVGDTGYLTLLVDVADALREEHRYVQLVEQKCEQAEIIANRRRFY